MKNNLFKLIDKLADNHKLEKNEYLQIINNYDKETASYLAKKATEAKFKYYENKVYIRGLIEISNICKNDCYYCGIRCSNSKCDRYRLSKSDILECCDEGYNLGFRTFVLQGGEDPFFTDDFLVDLITEIKAKYPDCAVTLSLGERPKESYKRLRDAGADRYLLRHETSNQDHYAMLHPPELTLKNRLECLYTLRELGFQVGCGFMVGSPFQTNEMLADELVFIEKFKPDMCGIGPFIPHSDTKFHDMPAGSVELTCVLLSCIRLIHPQVLLPSTTAMGTLEPNGREKGILAGANVVMPNLSPTDTRKKYMLYNNKVSDGAESAQSKNTLEKKIESIGHKVVTDRGDVCRIK